MYLSLLRVCVYPSEPASSAIGTAGAIFRKLHWCVLPYENRHTNYVL